MRVLVSGPLFAQDLQYVRGAERLQLSRVGSIGEIVAKDDLEAHRRVFEDADLVILNSVGSSLAAWWKLVDRIPSLRRRFDKRKPIFWSQDSHVMLNEELEFQDRFSRIYVAHSEYRSAFQTECEFLPCSFTKCSIDDLLKLRRVRLPKTYDVVFYFEPYGARASTIRRIYKKLRHHRVWFGRTYGSNTVVPFLNLLLLIKSASVVLNLSLKSDLNLRNFEALAMDAILMTDRTPDHDKVGLNVRNVLFYQRSLEDFEDTLSVALQRQVDTDASEIILEKHMLMSRYLDMINREMGQDMRLDVPMDRRQGSSTTLEHFDASCIQGVRYSGFQLLKHEWRNRAKIAVKRLADVTAGRASSR